jgi:hypothetical protein
MANRPPYVQHIITQNLNIRLANITLGGTALTAGVAGTFTGPAGLLLWQTLYANNPTEATALVNFGARAAVINQETVDCMAQHVQGNLTALQVRATMVRHLMVHLEHFCTLDQALEDLLNAAVAVPGFVLDPFITRNQLALAAGLPAPIAAPAAPGPVLAPLLPAPAAAPLAPPHPPAAAVAAAAAAAALAAAAVPAVVAPAVPLHPVPLPGLAHPPPPVLPAAAAAPPHPLPPAAAAAAAGGAAAAGAGAGLPTTPIKVCTRLACVTWVA